MLPARNNFDSVVVIGTPGCVRIAQLQRALLNLQMEPAAEIYYQHLVSSAPSKHLEEGSVFNAGYLRDEVSRIKLGKRRVLVRVESPGRHVETEDLLLALGNLGDETISRYEKGLIRNPRQWYRGWCSMLEYIATELAGLDDVVLMNSVADIGVMFDKELCHNQLDALGVPVPKSIGVISSFEHLIERMREEHLSNVFLKIANGSSGSGVVAYRQSTKHCMAITSVELVGQRLFNSRKIHSYSDARTIRTIIDELSKYHLWGERWLPKATLNNKVFDMRVLVIDGCPKHIISRSSRHPITNLHLLNERSDVLSAKTKLGESAWQALISNCERAMVCAFPNSFYGGLDVAVSPNFTDSAILEVNAFGDQLNDCLHNGEDTYTTEINNILRTTRSPWSNCKGLRTSLQEDAHSSLRQEDGSSLQEDAHGSLHQKHGSSLKQDAQNLLQHAGGDSEYALRT